MASSKGVTLETFYLACMEEIKVRIDIVNMLIAKEHPLSDQLVREFGLLQLRLIFELVAFGCLCLSSTHVDIGDLATKWNANDVMKKLEELNPHFFPIASTFETLPNGGFQSAAIEPSPMTKRTFLSLYGRFGDTLHRGTLRKLMASARPGTDPQPQVNLAEVRSAVKSLVALLDIHRISSHNMKTVYLVKMINDPTGKSAMITAAKE